ncbi:hypothetical protein FRB99_006384 [Tulasnella sp. 403]|nr:hypothetical protein FRB99_006384 [Tulasnella sp. 403]
MQSIRRSFAFSRAINGARNGTPIVRAFHASPAALKKRSKASTVEGDSGSQEDNLFDDDLFGNNVNAPSAIPSRSAGSPAAMSSSSKASYRAARFESYKATLLQRCSPTRDASLPPARKTSIQNLVTYTDTPEQLEAIPELLNAMRKAKVPLHRDGPSAFIRRCVSLRRPDIALKVLSDRPKYGLDMPDIEVARDLMHAIYIQGLVSGSLFRPPTGEVERSASSKPFLKSFQEDALLLAGLYPHFGLGEAARDPITSTLLIGMFAGAKPKPAESETSGPNSQEIIHSLASDLLGAIKRNEVLDVNAPQVPRRQRNWLYTELRKRRVHKSLVDCGFPEDILASLRVPVTTNQAVQ